VLLGQVPAFYTRAGEAGPPVVLVHGGASNRVDWRRTIPALADSWRVYAPDLPGYGQSPRDGGPYNVDRFYQFLREFLDALHIEKPYLVGHSLGARVCLEMARRTPERVAGLALVAPIGFGRLSRLGWLISTSFWAASKATRQRLPYPELSVQLEERHDRGLTEVAAPTLVLWGQRDLYFPHAYARRVQALIPHARIEVLPRSGHAPHTHHPDAFNQAVLAFLGQHLAD